MKTAPIVTAPLQFNAEGLPFSVAYDDLYHPRSGAFAQARHVFLEGSNLPARWRGRERFVVLETGFGLGNNFIATWDAWRGDAEACTRLHYIAVERHPLARADLATVHRGSALEPLARRLIEAWPPLTHNLHRLAFEGGRVELLLALGDLPAWLPEIVARVDAFYLDGFAPAKNPAMWQDRLFKAMGRMAAKGASVATWSAARTVREGLAAAGFEVRGAAGTGGKRDITLATYAPAFTPRQAAGQRTSAPATERHALIVGAGLAGCAAAWALAAQGWTSRVLDQQSGIAQQASGNPAGLFHGVVHGQDGCHARFGRAAALEAQAAVRIAIDAHQVAGDVAGALRLETSLAVPRMRALLARLGLPPDHVRAVDAAEAGALCGLALDWPAWFYPGGGWVAPAGLARSFIERAGAGVEVCGDTRVQSLHRAGTLWELLDAGGRCIAAAATVVLANAGDALRLLGQPGWPIAAVRGQLSLLRIGAAPAEMRPRLPIAGAGYLLPETEGALVFGATAQPGDSDPDVRLSDHRANLKQLARIAPCALGIEAGALAGRTAWRWVSRDRLPVVGQVPDLAAVAAHGTSASPRLDQPRFVPRLPGLFVFTALGSRGICWAALAAQTLAASITGAPSPVEASLLDAIDPARFFARAIRRGSGVEDPSPQPSPRDRGEGALVQLPLPHQRERAGVRAGAPQDAG